MDAVKPTRLPVIVAVALLLTGTVSAQWMEVKTDHYSILYQPGYEGDVDFARTWLNRAEELMKTKYGVVPDRYLITFYLHRAPTDKADTSRALNRCCTLDERGINTGSIDYLSPSAAAWRGTILLSSLGLPKNDPSYHAKVIMSEYIPIGHYAAQASRPSGGWRYYSAPEWFTQGLQEYDAIFHTTESNRTTAAAKLFEWARKNSTKFACCASGISIGDVYKGGAAFAAFLASEFGEDVHARLLRNSADTFQAALADVTKPYTVPELFERFRAWLDRTAVTTPTVRLAPRGSGKSALGGLAQRINPPHPFRDLVPTRERLARRR
jgi:hypothetical protein